LLIRFSPAEDSMTIEDMRKRAADFRQLAEAARYPDAKREYLASAEIWETIANKIEADGQFRKTTDGSRPLSHRPCQCVEDLGRAHNPVNRLNFN
jgi:hypothetical protein